MIVPGDFVHASLYFGWLTAVSYSRYIYRYHVPGLVSSGRLTDEAAGAFSDEAAEPTDLPAERVRRNAPPSDSEIRSLHSYDGITYVGTDDGLWQAFNGSFDSGRRSEYRRVLPRPTLDMDTTFGVAALAHGDGLSVIGLGSSWLTDDYFRPASDDTDEPVESVTWSHHDILGRTAPTSYQGVPADFSLRTRDHEKHYVFRRLRSSLTLREAPAGQIISAVAPRSVATLSRDNAAQIFVKKHHGWSGERDESADPGETSWHDFRHVGVVQGRVISLHELGEYMICELSDRVIILNALGRERCFSTRQRRESGCTLDRGVTAAW